MRAERIEASDLLDEMRELANKTDAILGAAIEAKAKPADLARVIREVRENIRMIGQLTGVLGGKGDTTVNDNRTQIIALRDMSSDELRAFMATAAIAS